LETHRAGQTGLLRLTWDDGDRTVLVNPELGGVTLGWKLTHTAQDELFAAFEGAAFHTRIILERMGQYDVPIQRIIHAGGVPRKNEVVNRVCANVLNKPVLVPQDDTTVLARRVLRSWQQALSKPWSRRRTLSARHTASWNRIIPELRPSTSSSIRCTRSCISGWATGTLQPCPPEGSCRLCD
jgi:sugar (pentulose or hexulose) kinase